MKGTSNYHANPSVSYDAKLPHLIPLLHVAGALVFARDRDTELNVAVLKVGGGKEKHSGVADVNGHKMAPIHFHLCRDSLRGESVVGVAIVDSHNRWVTIHNTQYMVVRDCVGYRSVGHGFFLEDGTEVYNVLDRNLGVQAYDGKRLPDQALPFDPNDGGAFWWANGRNTFTRNTACENYRYGFRYDSQMRSNFDSNLEIRQPDGKTVTTDIRTLPIYRFDDNESHTEGLYSFAFAGTEGVGPDRNHPHRMRGNTAWQTHYAMRMQLPMMWVEDADIDRAVYGVYRPRFDHHVYKNLRISQTNSEPFNRGLDDRSQQHGPVTIDGLTFSGLSRSGIPFIQLRDYNFTGWSVKLSGLKPGKLKLTALAIDKAGNQEETAHILMIIIVE
jgi:hypothetical protein